MRLALGIALWVVTASPGAAHTAGPASDAGHLWNFDPLVVVPLVGTAALYGWGVASLWQRAGPVRGIGGTQVLFSALGLAALAAALVSPLDGLSDALLSAHMAQHGLLIAVAPPLLLLGRPGVAFAWAPPSAWRKRLLLAAPWRAAVRVCDALSRPLVAAILHGLALWIWHAPFLFEAAAENYGIHLLEHASFFLTALLFWNAVIAARSSALVVGSLAAASATLMHGGLLGGLMTMARYPLYASYEGGSDAFGLTALQDQQLAGLVMWVPLGLVYFLASLALASRLISTGRPSIAG